jgi:putative hemolysin
LSEALEIDLPEGEWNTVAGLVFTLAGRVPLVGDEVSVSDHVFRVVATRRRRITRVEVTRL